MLCRPAPWPAPPPLFTSPRPRRDFPAPPVSCWSSLLPPFSPLLKVSSTVVRTERANENKGGDGGLHSKEPIKAVVPHTCRRVSLLGKGICISAQGKVASVPDALEGGKPDSFAAASKNRPLCLSGKKRWRERERERKKKGWWQKREKKGCKSRPVSSALQ